ncbi:MAG TPA: 4-hydroxy-3-methylbut-2-enyl diphosphate reductase [Acidimicrobiales bacterium]
MSRAGIVLTPTRPAARAVAGGAPGLETIVTGAGPERARRAAINLSARCRGAPAVAVVTAGPAPAAGPDPLGGPGPEPGDVVVASAVPGPHGPVPVPGASLLAAALARAGLRVHGPAAAGPWGPGASAGANGSNGTNGAHGHGPGAGPADAPGDGDGRAADRVGFGDPEADAEAGWLAAAAGDRPLAAVRVVTPPVPPPGGGTVAPAGLGLAAYRSLRRVGRVLAAWATAVGPRRVLLAEPRSFCAGVERAIEVVERALDRYGPPVYVRRQIIHNRHVVADLEARGAVFVDEVDEAPEGARLVFSAHGVAPAVEAAAAARGQTVIDATCPLVAKVHREVRRFARRGYGVVLVGHAHHDEVEGTMGEDADIRLVSTPADAAAVEVPDPERVAYVTQTTLALDEVEEVVGVLRDRFPTLVGPSAADICYATQNRQDAVRAIADECDLVLVAGSQNSSNSHRLVEVAGRSGSVAHLVDDERDIELAWLAGARTVGVTAGASAPPWVVERLVEALASLGPIEVETRAVTAETVRFPLPEAVC